MPTVWNDDSVRLEHQLEMEKAALLEREASARRNHEALMLKLKIELQGKQKRALSRTEAVQRVCLALVKSWTLPLVLLVIWLLMARKREVPQYLQDYMNL